MNVELPDGTVIQDVPDGMSQSQLVQKLQLNGMNVPKEWLTPKVDVTTPEFKQWQEKSAIDMWRAEHPTQAAIVDTAKGFGGASGRMISSLMDKFLPRQEVTQDITRDTGYKTAGEVLSPESFALFGGATKAASQIPRLGKYAQGIVGGAVGGGLVGATSESGDTSSGAVTGAGAMAILPKALKYAANGAGWAVDLLSKRLVDIRAGKVMHDVAGEELPQIMAALKNAGKDVTTSQHLYEYGIKSTGMSALGERAAKNDSQFNSQLISEQKKRLEDTIKALAGGSNATEVKQATQSAIDALNAKTQPLAKIELNAANTAGKLVPQLEEKIAQKTSSNARAMQDAGGFYSEYGDQMNKAGQTFDRKLGYIGQQKVDRNVARAVENYNAATDFAKVGLQRNQEKAFAQMQLDSLAAHGLNPIDTSSIVKGISSKLNDPSLAGLKPMQRVMGSIAQEVQDWTARNGGVIDANALYSIRKNAISNEVQSLMGSADPKAQAKMTAGILTKINPIIDKAIEDAGGTGWKNYLKTYELGMNEINKQKLGGKALEALNTSPDAFLKLVRGNSPDTVRKIFSTEIDIQKAMGNKNFGVLNTAASQIERDQGIKQLASEGSSQLSNVLAKDALRFKFPHLLNWKFYAANKGLDIIEGALDKKTMAKVYNAMRNGKDASKLMEQLPSADKNKLLSMIKSGAISPYVSTMAATQGQ